MRRKLFVLLIASSAFLAALSLDRRALDPMDSMIPIFFHLIQDDSGSEGLIPEGVLLQQLDSLNAAFEGTGLVFRLQGFQQYRNGDWFNNLTVSSFDLLRDEVFSELSIDPDQIINVYTARLPEDSFHGVSKFPDDQPESSDLNGILLDFRVLPGMGGKPNQPISDTGDWLIHEMGHYFGLFHTFEAGPWVCSEIEKGDEPNCNSSGDFLCSTAPHLQPLPSERSSCIQLACNLADGDNGRSDAANHNLNFMNYTSDACRSEFTPDQRVRMLATATTLRPTLVNRESVDLNRGSSDISIYPNPAATNVTVEFYTVTPGMSHFTVADMLGRTVINRHLPSLPPGKHVEIMDVESLAPGSYIVRIVSGRTATSKSIFVVR